MLSPVHPLPLPQDVVVIPFLLPSPRDIDKAAPPPTIPPPRDDDDSARRSHALAWPSPFPNTRRDEHAGRRPHALPLLLAVLSVNPRPRLHSSSRARQLHGNGNVTSSKVSERLVPDTNQNPCIALPKHEQFIAFSPVHTVTSWDTSTHTQHPLTLQHLEDIRSIAFSPDNWTLAIGGGEKITSLPVSTLSCWVISSLNSFLVPVFGPSVSPTSYFPRTRHPNRRCYTRLVEARSPQKRRGVIDCIDQSVAEPQPSCTR